MEAMFIDFMNSAWSITHPPYQEPLQDPVWIRDWLIHWDCQLSESLRPGQIERLLEMRQFGLEILDTLSGKGSISESQLIKINQYLSDSPLLMQISSKSDGYQKSYQAVKGSFEHLVFRIFDDMVGILSKQESIRLKRCQNPACGWVFFDESKNTTRKWCCNTCASLMKVRKFRTRHKIEKDEITEKSKRVNKSTV
jgi:hypothetical protein